LLERSISSVAGRQEVSAVLTDSGEEIPCDMLVLSMGVRPDTRLARGCGLAIGHLGGIKVNPLMMTSDPDIFAAGDAVEVNDLVTGFPVLTALAGPANKQGRVAADNALGRRTVYRGTLGTSIVKVFGLTVSSTGASEKTLRMREVPHLVSYTHSNSHAGFYPGAEMMTIKLAFSPGSGRILGCQIVGGAGVDKRIDVMATAIRGSMTVFDLEDIDLAYAPPFSSARDPVNIAGFVASNILKGDHEVVHAGDLKDIGENAVLLDLRDMEDLVRSSPIEGAVHVPLGRLRKKMEKLDREKLYITYCEVGTRSYVGHRVLAQRGFKSKNLSGGYKTYAATMKGN
ncbi:MAG TPA: FAD-dependent oxidoreductase, partial [Syntrophorhabdaceae bacterium]|nr:FAD-dependent oxidoreductase [Syntrophorhabdaceae bacterium]